MSRISMKKCSEKTKRTRSKRTKKVTLKKAFHQWTSQDGSDLTLRATTTMIQLGDQLESLHLQDEGAADHQDPKEDNVTGHRALRNVDVADHRDPVNEDEAN